MRVAPLAVVLSIVFAAAVVPGCENGPKDAPLIAAPTSPVADVPVPAGFEMVNSESTSRVVVGSGTRTVDHTYKGSENFLPVVKFYKEQMAKNKWALQEQTQGNGSVTLHFTKGSEECFVTVTDGTWLKHTRIRVKIDPMAKK